MYARTTVIVGAPQLKEDALIKVEVEKHLVSTMKFLVANVDKVERANRILHTKITHMGTAEGAIAIIVQDRACIEMRRGLRPNRLTCTTRCQSFAYRHGVAQYQAIRWCESIPNAGRLELGEKRTNYLAPKSTNVRYCSILL